MIEPIFNEITTEYLKPFNLSIQMDNIVNSTEYKQWHSDIDGIISVIGTAQINKIDKVK